MLWKPDWDRAKEHHIQWWRGEGLVLNITVPREPPIEDIREPAEPVDMPARWLDADYRVSRAEYQMADTVYLADAFPHANLMLGPGSLSTMLGAEPYFTAGTVWYEPCIDDPETFGPICFEPTGNRWLDAHLSLIDEAVGRADGRYGVGMPDMIENIDTLAAMRDNQPLLIDLIERPAWVRRSVDEINEAFFAAFEILYDRIRDADDGNIFTAFDLWGPGKTAKVQCDLSCMISPAMFGEFVTGALTRQCEWLDYSCYHLDGTTAMQHLDALLAIEPLDAIEWTPQAGLPDGGDPRWFDLYRRIKAAGKSVQAVGVKPEEVPRLLDAVGPEGMYVHVRRIKDRDVAEKLVEAVEAYR